MPEQTPGDAAVWPDRADGRGQPHRRADRQGSLGLLRAHAARRPAVRKGDRVRKGQVLGLLGNTGNTDGPHLHFHIMDGPSPLQSNGLPFVYSEVHRQGLITDEAALLGGQVAPIDSERPGGRVPRSHAARQPGGRLRALIERTRAVGCRACARSRSPSSPGRRRSASWTSPSPRRAIRSHRTAPSSSSTCRPPGSRSRSCSRPAASTSSSPSCRSSRARRSRASCAARRPAAPSAR